MTFRNKLTLHSKQRRTNEKWLFGLIFVLAIIAVCWLLL
jgi:hypothetical protein